MLLLRVHLARGHACCFFVLFLSSFRVWLAASPAPRAPAGHSAHAQPLTHTHTKTPHTIKPPSLNLRGKRALKLGSRNDGQIVSFWHV